ncbi:carotene isomerase [Gracilaria domingensis]|nr:carotene isomerase [Gracilaria domingensis]
MFVAFSSFAGVSLCDKRARISQSEGFIHRASQAHASHGRVSIRNSLSDESYDVITIGSGLGGLCASALLSTYGLRTLTLESHTETGGAAHCFSRRTAHGSVTFESGPHLFSGLQYPSDNPMYHVLRAVDARLDVTCYDAWGVFLPDTYVRTTLRAREPLFEQLLNVAGGPTAHTEMSNLTNALRPLGEAASILPPAALRASDITGSLRVASRYILSPSSLSHIPRISQLSRPFSTVLDRFVSDDFARNFMNLLCFLLAGTTAERVPVAEVAFMFREWLGDDAVLGAPVLQRPVGGASAVAKSLIEAIERRNGVVQTRSHVNRVLIEAGRATGVQLKSGRTIRAKKAVISNVSALDVHRLLPGWKNHVDKPRREGSSGEMCPSFMHLHIALELTDDIRSRLPHGTLEPNYVSVEDWSLGLEHPDNVVLISVPSVLDQGVCPAGHAVLHAYTPATEPFENWSSLEPGTPEYDEFKDKRSQVLWRAVNLIFNTDIRPEAYIKLIGTPKTHARFLRRRKGSYGPKVNKDARFGASISWIGRLPRAISLRR